jgi:hypothetical protein
MATNKAWLGRSRTFWALIAALVVLLTGADLFGLQTLAYFQFSHQAKRFPVINFTPTELKSQSANPAAGLRISHAGFVFEVPWTDLNREKSKIVGNWDILAFDSGLVVVFCPPNPNHEDLMSEVQKQLGNSRENPGGGLSKRCDEKQLCLSRRVAKFDR